MAQLKLLVVTPEETALEETAEFVALPLYDGEIGISAGHAPMIGRLGYGEMRLGHGDSARRLYLDSGFVQIADNIVSVLTQRAIPVEKLDSETLRQQLTEAQSKPSNSPELMEIRDREVTQLRAQLRMAK